MAKNRLLQTQPPIEKAYLVGIEVHNQPKLLSIQDSLSELALLADTAGLKVIGSTYQKVNKPNPATLIGSGKAEEIKLLTKEKSVDLVIFDEELSPRHIRELEKIFDNNLRVIDRTVLILDIFAQHAQSKEGKLQVELAQYEYLYPRLTRAWTHLARQAGGGAGRSGSVGGVGLRGPGETQLEVDRRGIRHRIKTLNAEIDKFRAHRERSRANRKKTNIPVITLVGYTNSGKSTLINQLTKSDVYVADKLFASLDTTIRRLSLPSGNDILITDTVGFIQKLPTQLIAAFRATLEEITEADMLLLLVDISNYIAIAQWKAVKQTLAEIGAENIPIITVLNKIDSFSEFDEKRDIPPEFFNAIPISALKSTNLDLLIEKLDKEMFDTFIPIKVRLPYSEGKLISIFHRSGHIQIIQHGNTSVQIQGSLPNRYSYDFSPFIIK